jgi:ribosomal-protein-alanine N-acetyltransferase
VRASNTRARAIYERHGYRQVGERKRYYPVHHGERETAIIMSMPLYGPEP